MSDVGRAAPGRFARGGVRNRFTARRATVLGAGRVAPSIVRVTVSGPDFGDFASTGPADHVRVFFPDAATGELVAPRPIGDGDDGIIRPDRESISRDFTPLPRTTPDGMEVDLDFFVHPNPGPASSWAETARPGDELVLLGPRGSRHAPQEIDGLILICDETSLPSASRWVRDMPPGTPVRVIATVSGPSDWVMGYLGSPPDLAVQTLAPDGSGAAVIAALDLLGPIGDGVFVWAAGEAASLVAVRRHLRRTLGLPAAQAQVSGYWRRGVEAFDHHAPIDPFDPDE